MAENSVSEIATSVKKQDRRRRDDAAMAMFEDYKSGLSLHQVGKKHGRTRQSVYGMFSARGWVLRTIEPLPFVTFNGNKYTMRNTGYYARTDGERTLLHRDMWEDANGLIPHGFDIHHKDENKLHNELSNFECIPKPGHARLHNPQQPTPAKRCEHCGATLVRKMRPSGDAETPYAMNRRRYCNATCGYAALRGKSKARLLKRVSEAMQ